MRTGLKLLSGWQDSNLRPSGPKPDALTGLRYTPLRPPKLSSESVALAEDSAKEGFVLRSLLRNP